MQLFLLLFLACTVIASVFGATYGHASFSEPATAQARLDANAGAASSALGASLQASSARQVRAEPVAPRRLAGAEPLLLLLLGSVLFCAAAGVSLLASRTGSDKPRLDPRNTH